MSAYLVPDFHINALISFAALQHGARAVSYYWEGKRREIRNDERRCASVLYAQNVRSVNARYQSADEAHGFNFRLVPHMLQAVDIIKACHGYSYQACETADWQDTEAYAIVQGIEASAIRMLPGYAESDAWCLNGPAAVSARKFA